MKMKANRVAYLVLSGVCISAAIATDVFGTAGDPGPGDPPTDGHCCEYGYVTEPEPPMGGTCSEGFDPDLGVAVCNENDCDDGLPDNEEWVPAACVDTDEFVFCALLNENGGPLNPETIVLTVGFHSCQFENVLGTDICSCILFQNPNPPPPFAVAQCQSGEACPPE